MPLFLVMQANYTTYQVGLFSDAICIQKIVEDKNVASKNLIPSIELLLKNNQCSLKDVSALGINQGPGPFTSLRTIVTTANGLSFATNIALIGINSLEALLQEHSLDTMMNIALLNAFNHDLYFGYYLDGNFHMGCKKNKELWPFLKTLFQGKKINFIGNGTILYQKDIEEFFGAQVHFPQQIPEGCSLEQLAMMVNNNYKNSTTWPHQLLPIYLKDMLYVPQI